MPKPHSTTVLAFARAVGKHWSALMSGGVITVALGIFERLSGKTVPLWVYGGILLFFIFLACYLAWRDERKDVGKPTLNDQEAKRARHRQLRERLGELFAEGDRIRWGAVSQRTGWNSEHGQWLKKVKEFLTQEPEFFDGSHIARFDAEQLVAIKEFIKEFKD